MDLKEKIKELQNLAEEIREKNNMIELEGIPKEVIEIVKRGEYGDFDFNSFPKGHFVSKNVPLHEAGTEGTIIYGKFIVVRNGNIKVISFANNIAEIIDYYDFTNEVNWYDNLEDGDIIIAVKLTREEHCRGEGQFHKQVSTILLRKPYIYIKSDMTKEDLINKINEWFDTMMINLRKARND